MRMLVLGAALLLAGCATTDDDLRAELMAMGEEDQAFRMADVDAMSPEERSAHFAKGSAGDVARAARLAEIIDEHGWPTTAMVGEEGTTAAFLIVQHADHDPAFQAACLPILEAAAERGEIKWSHVAYLTDRVRVKEGRPQVYGTQYSGQQLVPGGPLVYLAPIVEDPDRLDERRADVGLGPWIEYERQMAEMQGRDMVDEPRSPDDG